MSKKMAHLPKWPKKWLSHLKMARHFFTGPWSGATGTDRGAGRPVPPATKRVYTLLTWEKLKTPDNFVFT